MNKSWLEPIVNLKGIGPSTAQKFQQLGLFTIKDLLFHFPFRYEDIQVRELESILDQEKVTLQGKVVSSPVVAYFGRKKSRLSFKLAIEEQDIIQVTFFNQPYLKQGIELGQTRAVYGKWQANKQTLLGMRLIKEESSEQNFEAIYSSKQGLKQTQILKAIKQALDDYEEVIPELVPSILNDKYRLISLKDALLQMHFPSNDELSQQAKRKIIFTEFFLYQLRLQLSIQKQHAEEGIRVLYDVQELKQVINSLPYDLTQAQKKSVNEICYDLMAPYPMKRMLQGDVGSGKTLVAFITLIAAIQAGYQTALMVPTEILAKQHVLSFNRLFEPLGLHAELLVSAMTMKEKKAVNEGLVKGRIRIVIGTHALIQENVQFRNLGYVVIDEQHRFGVGQRQALINKGPGNYPVNLLQMTATPIPRSLALTLYGELSVSTIDQLPSGRQPIQTKLVAEKEIDCVYQHIQEELSKGHQIYYVLPLIDTSEHMEDIKNVLEVQEKLRELYPNYQIQCLHGQMDKLSQQLTMDAFNQNKCQILVATTMVEVGVDVPNATIIVIQSAERFGLAQLHQLRGRVGRSSLASYCYLIAKPTTEQGKSRMQIMVESQDGFRISEEDMRIRGMGDVMGRSQSGLPQFHYANPIEDQTVLTIARFEAHDLIKGTTIIEENEYQQLLNYLSEQVIEL